MEGLRESIYLPQVIPGCLRQMTRSPPLCPPQEGDFRAIQTLRELGKASGSSSASITQATNLASGLSDVIVILERPRAVESHCPNQSFDKFVQDCATLKAVDELLRFASRGTRDIGTVTVIDAFSLQPQKDAQADLRCEKVLGRFLRLKKPRVIIQCTNTAYKSPWMTRFNFGGRPYRTRSEHIEISQGHTALVIPSFHPSHAINYSKYRLELRVLHMYHFALAFQLLSGGTVTPCCMTKIQDLCLDQGYRDEDKSSCSDWDLASCIAEKISDSYLHGGKDVFPLKKGVLNDKTFWLKTEREAESLDALGFWLDLLLKKPQKFELFGIASARFLLRTANVNSSPIYSRISSALHGLVTERDHWFFETEDTDFVERIFKLALHDDPQISRVINANRQACLAVEETLARLVSGAVVEFPAHNSHHHPVVIAQRVLAKYLANSQKLTICTALRMEALSKRCLAMEGTLWGLKEAGRLPNFEVALLVQSLLNWLKDLRKELESIPE